MNLLLVRIMKQDKKKKLNIFLRKIENIITKSEVEKLRVKIAVCATFTLICKRNYFTK